MVSAGRESPASSQSTSIVLAEVGSCEHVAQGLLDDLIQARDARDAFENRAQGSYPLALAQSQDCVFSTRSSHR